MLNSILTEPEQNVKCEIHGILKKLIHMRIHCNHVIVVI